MATRKNFMFCYPFSEKRLKKNGFPVLCQPKLDGERTGNIYDINSVKLESSSGEIINSVPHINEFLEAYKPKGQTLPPLDGELYVHGWTWEDIHGVVSRTVNFHPRFKEMEFHIFDLRYLEMFGGQADRLTGLWHFLDTLPKDGPIKRVRTDIAFSFEDVWKFYNEYVELGYEGIVTRAINNQYLDRRSTQVMKFKPKKDDWYDVIGVEEEYGFIMSLGMVMDVIETSSKFTGIDPYRLKAAQLRDLDPLFKAQEPKGRLGSIVCKGSTGDIFSVYSGMSDNIREKYWNVDITGWLLHVKYQHITPGKGIPLFPVFMELVNPDIMMR